MHRRRPCKEVPVNDTILRLCGVPHEARHQSDLQGTRCRSGQPVPAMESIL
jgi:hypothetical protein